MLLMIAAAGTYEVWRCAWQSACACAHHENRMYMPMPVPVSVIRRAADAQAAECVAKAA